MAAKGWSRELALLVLNYVVCYIYIYIYNDNINNNKNNNNNSNNIKVGLFERLPLTMAGPWLLASAKLALTSLESAGIGTVSCSAGSAGTCFYFPAEEKFGSEWLD